MQDFGVVTILQHTLFTFVSVKVIIINNIFSSFVPSL